MISKQKLTSLPLSPGCYLFKNKEGEVIYVGKAKHLRKRVSSYFQKNHEDSKTIQLVRDIQDIDFISTRTEVEALLLENSLIKKHYPRYNIDLKDAQRYAYIHVVTNTEFPYIEVERSKESKGEYYGPFVSGFIRRLVIEVLSRNFKILIKKPSHRLRKLMDKEQYLKRVEQARKILKGEVDSLIKELESEREKASNSTYYEYALTLQNRIHALESLKEKQYVELTKAFDAHIINYIVSGEAVYLLVFSVRKGVLEGKQEYVFSYSDEFLNEFLLRYYDSAPIPHEVIVPQKVDPSLEAYLIKLKKKRVYILTPTKGEKKQLLDLVLKNVHDTFFFGKGRLIELREALKLPKLPLVMECFDISHFGGTNTVASMVSFKEGVPDKTNYRKFKIRTPTGGDDYLAMEEVIERRYRRVKEGSIPPPDLIIIDGGKGQLHAAEKIVKDLKLSIPIISLAKQFEEIYTLGSKDPVCLPKNHKGLQLIQSIRDEAHRFAITYQRLLRKKELFEKK